MLAWMKRQRGIFSFRLWSKELLIIKKLLLQCISIQGGLALAVEGPSKAEIKCVDNKDGTCNVTYFPKKIGQYEVTVKFADKHVAGSPFKANVVGKSSMSNLSALWFSDEEFCLGVILLIPNPTYFRFDWITMRNSQDPTDRHFYWILLSSAVNILPAPCVSLPSSHSLLSILMNHNLASSEWFAYIFFACTCM